MALRRNLCRTRLTSHEQIGSVNSVFSLDFLSIKVCCISVLFFFSQHSIHILGLGFRFLIRVFHSFVGVRSP